MSIRPILSGFWSRVLAGAALTVLAAGFHPVLAHEFWIEPQRFQVNSNASLQADLRNGQRFDGIDLAYFDHLVARHEVVQDGKVQAVAARMGDLPAFQLPPLPEGLAVLVHQTRPARLLYTDWAAFETFLRHKDLAWAIADHRNRGLPETRFFETYTRHAKSLVAVGHGRGADRLRGLEIEFLALANPYGADLPGVCRCSCGIRAPPGPRPRSRSLPGHPMAR